MKKAKIIDNKISQWSGPAKKKKYLEFYSPRKWASTSQARKLMHTLRECKCCSVFHPILVDSFPGTQKVKKLMPEPSFIQNKICKLTEPSKPKREELTEIGQRIYSDLNKECQEKLGKSFSDILTLVPESGLAKKVSPVERKKKNRDIKRGTKRTIEEAWARTDVSSHLSQRVSFAARKKRRLQENFESKKDAANRVEKENQCEGKKKSHIPQHIVGNIEQLMIDVETWPLFTDNQKAINWSQKAREYNIRKKGAEESPPNAGQLLKEYLKSREINVAQYEEREKGLFF